MVIASSLVLIPQSTKYHSLHHLTSPTPQFLWVIMGSDVWPATGLGPLMEADLGSLTTHTPCHHWAGIRLWEATRPRSGDRKVQSEVPGDLLEYSLWVPRLHRSLE